MQRRGEYSARQNAGHRTDETGYSSLRWPTATVGDSKSSRRRTTTTEVMHKGTSLTDAITIWPTPTARDWKDGANPSDRVPSNGLLGRVAPRDPTSQPGQLNPDWVERLMGLPRVGWTDFDF